MSVVVVLVILALVVAMISSCITQVADWGEHQDDVEYMRQLKARVLLESVHGM